jgi:hypothetical protein
LRSNSESEIQLRSSTVTDTLSAKNPIALPRMIQAAVYKGGPTKQHFQPNTTVAGMSQEIFGREKRLLVSEG